MVTLEAITVAIIFTLALLLLPRRLFPKRFVFTHTLANEDLYLEDCFHSLVRRGTWRHNNGNWYENDVLWTDTRAHKTVSQSQMQPCFILRSRGEKILPQHWNWTRKNWGPINS